MFGIPIDGLDNVFCDNECVCSSYTFAKSKSNQNNQFICFHRESGCVAAGILIPQKSKHQ